MPSTAPSEKLITDLLASFDQIFGLHPGFRAAHAKGIICSGTFSPSPAAAKLTRAPHANQPVTPVIVRFSDSTGVSVIPDNDPNASPRGIAIRFMLVHVHTDIVAHSTEGFPASTGEEFLEFLHAVAASGPDAAHPSPIEQFLGSHPAAAAFVMAPKPIPPSFANESFFAVSAVHFTNAAGETQFGRLKIRPVAGNQYLSTEDAAAGKSPTFLMDEMGERLAKGPVQFKIFVQFAAGGDVVDDATIHWPADREEIEFGTITITKKENELEPELRKIIFDPRPRVDGIEASNDPLFEIRAAIYLLSGRRRRAATTK